MTEREALDRVIEMRQQVINGGTLFCDPATGESRSSVHDIVNKIDDFATVSRLLEKKDYNCKFHVESVAGKSEKRIPLTKDDLDARFLTGKTMRISTVDGSLGAIGAWSEKTIFVDFTHNAVGQYEYKDIMAYVFVDGDLCWKVEE